MHFKRLLLIDDFDPKPVVILLSEIHPDIHIEQLQEKRTIREQMQLCTPEDTLILLNAHIRFEEGNLRSNFLGIRFLRRELRTEWRRREAVVIYSPIPQDAFLNIPINRILYAHSGHYYYNIIKLKSIVDIIKNAKPIESENALDEIIQRYGGLSGLVRTFKHDIENKLPVKGSGWKLAAHQRTLSELERLVLDLVTLIPQRFHQEFLIEQLKEEMQKLIVNIQKSEENELEANIAQIRSILSGYNELCDQLFRVR